MVETKVTLDRVLRPSVKQIGLKAHRTLTTPGFSGRVVSVGSKAVYIATDDGELLAACPLDQQAHPRSLLTDLDLQSLREGLRIWTEDDSLHFGDGASLELAGIEIWHRPSAVAPCVTSSHNLRPRSSELLQVALEIHAGENLGLALPYFLQDKEPIEQVNATANVSPLINAGLETVTVLSSICRRGDLDEAQPFFEGLIGLGPGLTPSGDDFVGGLLFMARHLNAAYPPEGLWRGGDIRGLLARTDMLTTHISHTLLTDLAEGQSHESLHDLAENLVADSQDFDAAAHVLRVAQIGASSGWDMLTGMLAGLLPVIHRD